MCITEITDYNKEGNIYFLTIKLTECSMLDDDDYLCLARYEPDSGDTAECHGFQVPTDSSSIMLMDFYCLGKTRLIDNIKEILDNELNDNLWEIEQQLMDLENEK